MLYAQTYSRLWLSFYMSVVNISACFLCLFKYLLLTSIIFVLVSFGDRFILASGGCRFVIGVRSSDVFYSPFPLHHSVAGMIAIAGCFAAGFKFVLRKKFSASQYWKDCQKYKVTVSPARTLSRNKIVPRYTYNLHGPLGGNKSRGKV